MEISSIIKKLSPEFKREMLEFYSYMVRHSQLDENTAKMYVNYVKRIGSPISLDMKDSEILDILKNNITSNTVKFAFKQYLLYKKSKETDIDKIKLIFFILNEISYSNINKRARNIVDADDILSPEDISLLYRASRNEEIKVLIPLLYETGCRINELLQNFWVNVIWKEKKIKIPKEISKSGKMRFVEFDVSYPLLKRLFITKGEKINERIFNLNYHAVYNNIRRLGRRVLNRDIHPHLFRHSIATNTAVRMMKLGKNEAEIREDLRKYLGHASGETTRIYINIAQTLTDKGIIQKYGSALKLR